MTTPPDVNQTMWRQKGGQFGGLRRLIGNSILHRTEPVSAMFDGTKLTRAEVKTLNEILERRVRRSDGTTATRQQLIEGAGYESVEERIVGRNPDGSLRRAFFLCGVEAPTPVSPLIGKSIHLPNVTTVQSQVDALYATAGASTSSRQAHELKSMAQQLSHEQAVLDHEAALKAGDLTAAAETLNRAHRTLTLMREHDEQYRRHTRQAA